MTESVLWYVLAGFLLGFILSTLWEWLYFRRRRMRIENRRIAELEATVRSLSLTSQSTATENSVPSGFAAGYQSPGVFLEGEENDVDTVEVIVPASPEPLSFDQLADVQPVPESQYGTRQASSQRTPVSNGTGSSRERRPAVPVAAATIAAASVLSEDSDQQPAGAVIQADQPGEVTTNQVPPSQTYVDATLPPQPETVPAPASVRVESQLSPAEERYSQSPELVGDLSATKTETYTEPSAATQFAQPSEPVGTAGQGQASATPQAVAASEAALPPSTTQPGSPQVVSPLASQEPERDSSLKPALVAVIASTLGSKLADKQDTPPETSELGQPTTQAPSASAVPETVANTPEPPADKVMPGIYDLPADEQPDTPQNAPQSFVAGTNPDSVPDSTPESLPLSRPGPTPDLTQATAGTVAPNTTTSTAQDSALPLSAILPQAPKPAPVNKNGAVTRQAGPPAAALAAAGLDPEIEQVSNQLDDLIESLNGLIEKTQPLLQPPVSEDTSSVSPGSSAAAGGPPPAGERNLAVPLSAAEPLPDPITGEDMTGQGVTGPYTARNLSRTEYAMVQLMQAARRLGRDLRSAF